MRGLFSAANSFLLLTLSTYFLVIPLSRFLGLNVFYIIMCNCAFSSFRLAPSFSNLLCDFRTKKTQLSLINRMTHLYNGDADALKYALPYTHRHVNIIPRICHHVTFSRSTSKGVGINREEWGLSKMGSAVSRFVGACLTAYKHAILHVGYHAEFDCCWSDCTSVGLEIHRKKTRLLSFHLLRSLSHRNLHGSIW